jgi:hypothetical protein
MMKDTKSGQLALHDKQFVDSVYRNICRVQKYIASEHGIPMQSTQSFMIAAAAVVCSCLENEYGEGK